MFLRIGSTTNTDPEQSSDSARFVRHASPTRPNEQMRRRRSRMKSLKIRRLFAQGRIILFLILATCFSFVHCEPGYLDFDNLPETNFTCAGKVIGGYYADLETSCQMFHVCTIGQLDEPMDIKFLCLNGTVFDQETRVCERVDEVDCTRSERFYYLNLELYGNTMVPISEDDDSAGDNDDDGSYPSGRSSTTPVPHTTKTPKPTTTSTTTTTTTTTTRRPISTTTTTPRPQHKIAVKPLPPKNSQPNVHISSTVKPVHYVTTFKSYDSDQQQHHPQHHDDDEYEYDDDYAVTDGKELGSYHDTSGTGNHDGLAEQVFSPQQFIFNQNQHQQNAGNGHNGGKGSPHGGGGISPKPAISFQQQQFQNGGSLTVTNSHVTVTTHTAGNDHHQLHQLHPGISKPTAVNGNKQFSSRPKQTAALVAAAAAKAAAAAAAADHNGGGGGGGPTTAEEDHELINGGYAASTRKPDYAYGAPPTGIVDSKLPVFRLPAHGFRLPSPEQAEALVAAQNKHAAELKRHQEQIDEQLKQQHDQSPQEQHLRELELHQRRLEQQQQQELGKQLREQEHNRREQERERQEQERERQQLQTQATVQVKPAVLSAFEGYQRHNPQISLRLPIEHNPNQPQFLALAQADSDFPQREHKDTKRSDPHAGGGSNANKRIGINAPHSAALTSSYPTHASEYRESISSSSSRKSHQIVSIEAPQPVASSTSTTTPTTTTTAAATSSARHKPLAAVTTVQPSKFASGISSPAALSSSSTTTHHPTPTSATSTSSSSSSSSPGFARHQQQQQRHQHQHHHQQFDHRVLLTPQDQYIATLPKVIITASASVSDASGKKLNYSLGNSIGPNVKIPPPSYDEYRDDDVVLDPFYLDVPKIQPQALGAHGRRTTRSATPTKTTTQAAVTRSIGSRRSSLESLMQQRRRMSGGFAKRKRKK